MRKQLFKTVFATAMACTVAAMPALTVCAEDVTENIIADGESITIEGQVDTVVDNSSSADGAIFATNGGDITIDGDVVITNKRSEYFLSAIGAENGATVEIKGDYSFKASEEGTNTRWAALVGHDSTLIIDGDVSSDEYGIYNSNRANIYVYGDLSANNFALGINPYAPTDKYVVIDGVISSETESALSLQGYIRSDQTTEDIMDLYPSVAVFAMECPDEKPLFDTSELFSYLSGEEHEELGKEVEDLFSAAINYIIHTEGGEISFSGDDLLTAADFGIDDPDKNFTTTKFGKTFTATVGSNYALEGNESVEVTKISDGVYSVKLIDRKGGILLAATALSPDPGPGQDDPVVIIIPNATPSSSSSSEPQSSSSESSAVPYGSMPAGAVTVSFPRNAALTATTSAGPAVLGANREPSRTVNFKMGLMTDDQYKSAVINNINTTPAGGTLRIQTDRMGCFDSRMLEAFAKKSNIDLQVLFPLGSKKILVTIPAGFDVSKLLDDKGYCGFLRLLAILGGETLE